MGEPSGGEPGSGLLCARCGERLILEAGSDRSPYFVGDDPEPVCRKCMVEIDPDAVEDYDADDEQAREGGGKLS